MVQQRNIIHIVHSLAKGGITSFIEELVNHNDTSHVKHDILVWKTPPETSYKFDIIDISKSSNKKEKFQSIIKSYDRIFVHSLMPFMLNPLSKRRKDVYLFQHGITFGSGIKKRFKQLYYTLIINLYRFNIICSSKFAKQKLLKNVLVFNKRLILIIGFGININQHPKLETETNSKLKIGFAGRIVYQKRIFRIVKALKEIDKDIEIEFHVAGDGPQLQELKLKSKEFEGSKITFVFYGFLKNMDDFYQKINVFILPSVGESFGLVVLEALSRMIPTIVYHDSGACVEFIQQNHNGYVVKSENDLAHKIEALSHVALRNELKSNIRKMDFSQYDILNTRSKLDTL